ncbi:MAG: hypothetical protein PHI23_04030 [Candidatus Peribacteraceae bacterium]|nr:hypothetical protein [Candidatus Peribacteraceae bacterium]
MPRRFISTVAALLLCLLPLQAAHARTAASTQRPTSRAIRLNAPETEATVRRRALTTKTTLKWYVDELRRFSAQYPATWKRGFSSAPEIAGLADERVVFEPREVGGTYVGVGTKRMGKTISSTDLEKDFAAYTLQPRNAYELDTRPFLLAYNLLASGRSTWKGKSTLTSTFTFRCMSKNLQSRQIRIPDGNRIVILEYTTSPEKFEKDLHYFEDFVQAFSLLKQTSK